jgi:hypothetical protein
MPTVYLDIVEKAGAAATQDIYGKKVPTGKVLQITQLAVYERVTASGMLPYETATYRLIGLEKNEVFAVFRVRDTGTTDDALRLETNVWCPEGWRPWARSETSSTSNTVHLAVNGLLYGKKELECRIPEKT